VSTYLPFKRNTNIDTKKWALKQLPVTLKSSSNKFVAAALKY
jgi:hypothetical protein